MSYLWDSSISQIGSPEAAVEANQIPHGTHRVRPSIVDRDRGAGAGAIADGVGAVVGVRPNGFSLVGGEAEHSLDFAFHAPRPAVGHVDPPVGDGGTAVSRSNGNGPTSRKRTLGQLVQQAALMQHRVTVDPAPLRPVFRQARGSNQQRHGERQSQSGKLSNAQFMPRWDGRRAFDTHVSMPRSLPRHPRSCVSWRRIAGYGQAASNCSP